MHFMETISPFNTTEFTSNLSSNSDLSKVKVLGAQQLLSYFAKYQSSQAAPTINIVVSVVELCLLSMIMMVIKF